MELTKFVKLHNWNMPTTCPVCGSALELSDNHKQLRCTNTYCQSKSSGTIAKWCDKLKIKELGHTTIEKIQDLGYFNTISSLYIDIDNAKANQQLSELLGKNWKNIKTELNAHKQATLAQFIAGYNISGVGEKQVQKVLETFQFESIDDLDGENPSRFICDGIGLIISQKLSDGIKSNFIDMLKTLDYITIIKPAKITGGLSGKSFCFTGAMEYKRSVLQGYVAENGGVNFDSVKKGLDFLVMADPNSTSTKAVKARALGITIISPEDFLKMVNK